MTDLEHLTSAPAMVDPYITRVLVRTLSPAADFRAMGATGTSCSIIAIDEASNVTDQLDTECDSLLEGIRSEIILMSDVDAAEPRPTSRDRTRRSVRARSFGKPAGGRACVIADAVDRASNEFVVISNAEPDPLSGLSVALGHMWTDGADLAVLGAGECPVPPHPINVDTAAMVPVWLGLTGKGRPAETLVLRRWLARWIFNEIDRSLDPVEEIADRVRLLGVSIVYADVDEWIPDP